MLESLRAHRSSTNRSGRVAHVACLRLLAFSILVGACGMDETAGDSVRTRTLTQAVDTDSDGMDDAWETTHFGGLTQTAGADYDSDGMTNLEEYTYGFVPTTKDGFDDADGDRYPNVFELRAGSNPTSATSLPTPTYTVNPAGGGTHTTIGAAVTSASTSNGAYQIIAIAPGTYTGDSNLRGVTVGSSKPKLLFIGTAGAASTIIDGGLTNYGWLIQNAAVVSSLTFQKAIVAQYVDAPSLEVRLVDLVLRDNVGASWAAGVHIYRVGRLDVTGSTLLNNAGWTNAQQVWVDTGTAN